MQDLGKLGYKYQFVTLAGFHAINFGMFELAAGYKKRGMAAYSELQQQEFAAEARGYTATKHQREVCLQSWLVHALVDTPRHRCLLIASRAD